MMVLIFGRKKQIPLLLFIESLIYSLNLDSKYYFLFYLCIALVKPNH